MENISVNDNLYQLIGYKKYTIFCKILYIPLKVIKTAVKQK